MRTSFEEYYAELFGSRWESLKNSLLSGSVHAELRPGKEPYFLDPASLCAALCLPLTGKERIADLCAAPGGKSLVTAMGMDSAARLDANERSAARKARLVCVLDSSLSDDVRSRVTVSCSDAAPWCRTRTECYDAILLDAPCSSERHVLSDPKYLAQWSPARVRSLSVEQWALLSCAWRLLSCGGHILYATCALSPAENDGIVARLSKKFGGVEVLAPDAVHAVFAERRSRLEGRYSSPVDLERLFLAAERTRLGLHLLPDSASGCGPLYFSVIEKRSPAGA